MGHPSLVLQLAFRTSEKSSRSLIFLSARGVDPPGDADAEQVESQQGNCVDAHAARVRHRANDARHNKDRQDRVAEVLPQETRADDAEQSEKEDEDGQLETDAKAKNDG